MIVRPFEAFPICVIKSFKPYDIKHLEPSLYNKIWARIEANNTVISPGTYAVVWKGEDEEIYVVQFTKNETNNNNNQ